MQKPDAYPNSTIVLNGIKMGYNPSKKWLFSLGIRRVNALVDFNGGSSFEEAELRGMEYSFGLTYSPELHRKIYISYGLELFDELAHLEGEYWNDSGGPINLYERKNFFGVAPNVSLNVRLGNTFSLFMNSRYRFGWVNISQKENPHLGYRPFSNLNFWMGVFEPINSIGIRIRL